jgi:hypothetical protein
VLRVQCALVHRVASQVQNTGTHITRRQVTHLFRDVLHGWGRVLLVTNVSASAADYDETVAVLKYAALASTISTVARSGPLAAMPSSASASARNDAGA